MVQFSYVLSHKVLFMRLVQLIHNPGAGDEEHGKEDLIELIENQGFECRYSSTKNKLEEGFDEEAELLIVAGGDGTIRKVTKELVKRKTMDKIWPIGLLPLGTANNIAKTLELEGEPERLIKSWHDNKHKDFDVGKIIGLEETSFFLESLGFGIFPYLMKQMRKKGKEEIEDPENKMQAALKLLHQSIFSYESKYCNLKIDGHDYSGNYLLVEIMNTKSIGPNLLLAPNADPGDGLFNVIMIPEADKENFAAYTMNRINKKEESYEFPEVKGKEISVSWDGTHVHVDDEVIKLKKNTRVKIEMRKGLLQFLID
jgi:diacylglycerol kinase (ATP)